MSIVEDMNDVAMDTRAVAATGDDVNSAAVDVGALVEGTNDVAIAAAGDVALLTGTVVGFMPRKFSRGQWKAMRFWEDIHRSQR